MTETIIVDPGIIGITDTDMIVTVITDIVTMVIATMGIGITAIGTTEVITAATTAMDIRAMDTQAMDTIPMDTQVTITTVPILMDIPAAVTVPIIRTTGRERTLVLG